MTFPSPETDDASDVQRRRAAEAAFWRKRVNALYDLGRAHLSIIDRGFIIGLRNGDLLTLTSDQRDRLDRLVWKHRRALPAELAPKLPPFDPIVREQELAHV